MARKEAVKGVSWKLHGLSIGNLEELVGRMDELLNWEIFLAQELASPIGCEWVKDGMWNGHRLHTNDEGKQWDTAVLVHRKWAQMARWK